MKIKVFDMLIICMLIVVLIFGTLAISQDKEDSEWINWAKLYRDCEKKVSVEQAQYCAEKDSFECFERCLR